MTLNVAVVGVGNIGNIHATVYSKRSDVKLVAVCDIIHERSDRAAEKYGCQGFYSVQQMLASGIQIDAASMCAAGVENGGVESQGVGHLRPVGGGQHRQHDDVDQQSE